MNNEEQNKIKDLPSRLLPMKKVVVWINRLWPLPSLDKRKLWPFFAISRIKGEVFKLERDADYLLYQAGALMEKVSLLVFFLTLLEVFTKTNFFVDQYVLVENKTALVSAWGKVMGPVMFVVGLTVYLRIRLPMNIEQEQIPFLMNKEATRNLSLRDMRIYALFFAVVGLFMFPWMVPYFISGTSFVFEITHMRTNFGVAILLEAMFAFAVGPMLCISLSSALIYEKASRFGEKIYDDLENW